MASLAERLEEKGEARGRVAGLAEGEARGRAESLIHLLQRRFGPLSPAVQARIAAAASDELGNWLDQVLDAPSLEAIFGDAPRH